MSQPVILCAGETLWDVLPSGEFLGGAPFNVAGHAARLGARALLATRLGRDERGARALEVAHSLGIDTVLAQHDPQLPTGEARAVLDTTGSAHYVFLTPAAWDALEITPPLLDATSTCDAFVHGTLGQRDPRARAAISGLAAVARWRVFDPNLRAPHFDRALCEADLEGAGLVKINEDECRVFADWFGCGVSPAAQWEALHARFGIGALCVTLGAAGSRLYWHQRWYEQPAIPTEISDTVGAGDSFLAMLVYALLRGDDPQTCLMRAARLASFVASRPGAVPYYEAAHFS